MPGENKIEPPHHPRDTYRNLWHAECAFKQAQGDVKAAEIQRDKAYAELQTQQTYAAEWLRRENRFMAIVELSRSNERLKNLLVVQRSANGYDTITTNIQEIVR